MPLTRIICLKGRSADNLHAIAGAVREGLVETYSVPPDDCFLIIEQRQPGEIMADKLSVRPGLRREDVQVVNTSNDKPDLSFGNGVASYAPV